MTEDGFIGLTRRSCAQPLLEARLTWRFAGAMLAQSVAIIGGTAALVRLLAAG